MTALEFIDERDRNLGGNWTKTDENLVKALDEYAEIKKRKMIAVMAYDSDKFLTDIKTKYVNYLRGIYENGIN